MDSDWKTDPGYKVFLTDEFTYLWQFQAQEKQSGFNWIKCVPKGECPAERHSCAVTSVNDKVYLFGGSAKDKAFDDFWILDTKEMKWTKVEVKSKENPPVLWGHSMNAFGNRLFLFGGTTVVGGDRCDLWMFDIDKAVWSKPQQSGPAPTPRTYHASAVYGNRLLIFGGVANDNNLYVLNTDTMEWNRPETSGVGPDARKELTVIVPVKEKKMIVFGGVSQSNMETLNELHTMEFGAKVWKKVIQKGATPERRCGHIAILLDKTIVVYGGKAGGSKGFFGEIHFTSTEEINWAKSKGLNYKPEPRANHAATLVGNKIFIFGGITEKGFTNEMLLLEP